MAVTYGSDDTGPWLSVDCDAPACPAHVSLRPDPEDPRPDLAVAIDVAVQWAYSEGWAVLGQALCPAHTGIRVVVDGPTTARVDPEPPREPVKPGAAAAVAQRGLTGVH